jgi:phosphoesterase RecJ-like protein
MDIDWEPLRDILETNHRFVLSSHVRPDADALGSELALASFLDALGKSVRIVNPSGIPNNLRFLDPARRAKKIGEGITPEEIADTDVHIILDTSAWSQLQDVGKVFKTSNAKKVVIDHHVSFDDLGAVEFKDSTADSTGSLLYRLAKSLGYPLTKEIAVALFCAIATDTGWFRFPSTSSWTLQVVSELIDLGAEPHVVYGLLYEQTTLARIRLSGLVLQRVTLDCDGQLGYTWVSQKDFADTNSRPADTEDLVNECLRIAGTECAFIAIEQQNKSIKVSVRSRKSIDVSKVAEQFGGGGHEQAAGAILPGPLEEAKSQILAAMKAILN